MHQETDDQPFGKAEAWLDLARTGEDNVVSCPGLDACVHPSSCFCRVALPGLTHRSDFSPLTYALCFPLQARCVVEGIAEGETLEYCFVRQWLHSYFSV